MTRESPAPKSSKWLWMSELALLERLRGASGMSMDISPDPGLMPQVTAAKYYEALDRYGSPRKGYGLDPKASVDRSATTAALARLLPLRILAAGDSAPGQDPLPVEVNAAVVRPATPGCVDVIPTGETYHVALTVPGGAISLSGPGAGTVTMSLALHGYPAVSLAGEFRQALAAGSLLGLSRLPSATDWVLGVTGEGALPLRLCSITEP